MLSLAKHRSVAGWISLVTCVIFLINVSCAETMRVPVRDLEKLNEEKKTYLIRTEDGLGLYANEIVWSDTLVTILELDMKFHADSTAAVFDSLPMPLQVDDIKSIEKVISGRRMGIPKRDLEKLNEKSRKTYLIQTKDGLGLYAN